MNARPLVLAVGTQKGGPGMTTTAVKSDAGQAAKGVDVTLVDLDPQGHCAAMLGLNRASTIATIRQMIKAELDWLGYKPSATPRSVPETASCER